MTSLVFLIFSFLLNFLNFNLLNGHLANFRNNLVYHTLPYYIPCTATLHCLQYYSNTILECSRGGNCSLTARLAAPAPWPHVSWLRCTYPLGTLLCFVSVSWLAGDPLSRDLASITVTPRRVPIVGLPSHSRAFFNIY